MTTEQKNYLSWLQMTTDLELAIKMLEEHNYGLLKNQLDALLLMAQAGLLENRKKPKN